MTYTRSHFKQFILIAVLLLLPLSSALAQGGQSTPEELGQSKAAATQAKDKAALRALIHPEVVEHMQEHDPAKLEEILNAWTVIAIPENYLFAVKPVSEIDEYDAKTQTMNVTGQSMYFPVPPSHFMVMVAETQKTDSEGRTQTVRVPLGIDPISQVGGKWYIILPGVKEGQ
jgi:hypothetical protein